MIYIKNKIKMQWKWLMIKCIKNKSLKFSNKNDKISNVSAKDLQNVMLWFSDKRSWYIYIRIKWTLSPSWVVQPLNFKDLVIYKMENFCSSTLMWIICAKLLKNLVYKYNRSINIYITWPRNQC